MPERVIVWCTDCRKVVMIVPRLEPRYWRRLLLHFGHRRHQEVTRTHARRHVVINRKTEAPRVA